jgi:peptidoglycan/LPS O-acetylase OafA/YrhL
MGVLRFWLAFAVMVAHLAPFGPFVFLDGQAAVQAFYLISGFYMALVLDTKYAFNKPSVFYASRAARLFPLYVVVLLLSAVVSYVAWKSANSHPFAQFQNYPISAWGILGHAVSQLTMLGLDFWLFILRAADGSLSFTSLGMNQMLPYQGRQIDYLLVGVAWSLSLELYFYLLAPFVLRSRKVVMLLFLGSFLLRFICYRLGYSYPPFDYRFFPFEIGIFLAGSLAYYIYKSRYSVESPQKVTVLFFTMALFIATFTYSSLSGRGDIAAGFLIKHWAWLLLVWLALPVIFSASRNSAVDRLIGEFSYPIYLSHLLVGSFFHFIWHIPIGPKLGVISLVSTLLFSALTIPLQARIDKARAKMVLPSS